MSLEEIKTQTEIPQDLLDLKSKYDKGELVEMALEFQNYIESAPVSTQQMYTQAASSDGATIEYWREIWIKQIRENHEKFGSFANNSIGKFFNAFKYKPAIIAGSGPSLKKNGHLLKNRGDIPLISCLHNFHFFEDQDIKVDFYVTLDAGPITVEEVYEGGKNTPEWYWERTKGKILFAYIGTHPDLLKKWQGEVYFYSSPIADKKYSEAVSAVETFNTYVGTGGNVLGACLYIAKGYLGCNPIAFVGADFSFSYTKKFHGWDSKYDANLGLVLKACDIYGNKVLTWQSYNNFKSWFDSVCLTVPGIWINCTEGGTLGAFYEGNIMAIKQMKLKNFLEMYEMSKHLEKQALSPGLGDSVLLF
jgi:hypothetical protein